MDKVALITGATNGIGLATAKALAQMGVELFLVSRNLEKGKKVSDEIKSETGNQRLHLLMGDLSSLASVRQIAQSFLSYNRPLHILLNNAGVFNLKRRITIDGHEEMFAVNHIAHFLLTNLLLNRIKACGPSRIINVASGAHMLVNQINFADLNFEKGFRPLKVYSHSKLANLLFTHELARRLEASTVTVNSVDPGEVATGLGTQNSFLGRVISRLMKPFLQSPEKGARTSVYVCTSPNVKDISGRNFRGCKEKKPKPWATNPEASKQLWEISQKWVEVDGKEICNN
ncbi:SDR family oxidoreductase [Flagellimonas allohymeniacidonis]|uniref:SDR family oxidoreductase n=2 Tax=Flagellimonas allohymeniacidonis TaxID=2517819 RepID=A0A4Q8QNA2_9FLAO|nr:SDR family oxidoreductase [Allomuricauda hymeniacidonis]